MSQPQLLWEPSPQRAEQSQMYAFMQQMSQKYNFQADWPSLHEWSVGQPDQFWQEMLEFAEIIPNEPASETCLGVGLLMTQWFPGMTFNFAEHLLRFNDDRIALACEDERGRSRTITYRQLRDQVARCAAGLRAVGVQPGDRVAGYLPNIAEAVIGMLASASMGAVWSSCSPDFGINGIFDRFGQIEPKVLIAADGYTYNEKKIDCLDRIKEIVERIESIEQVVVVPFVEDTPDLSSINKAISWPDFTANEAELVYESFPFDHPLYIMYSSGTTGVPKCIIHGAGGTLLQHMKELMLHCDLRREDTIFYFTTCGWMMWNWLVSSLGVGATVVLYEGSPAHPTVDRLWQMADKLGVTIFGTSPKFLAASEKAGLTPGTLHDLSKLRTILSTGSPLTIENFQWVYVNVKEDLQLSSICGGTDIISCFMLGNPILPVYAGEIQSRGLGMDVQAFDADGKSVIDQKGELVCCGPFPSQPTGFWNDRDGSKYSGAYFERFADVWTHGDFVEITSRGGVVVYGRSDATLNPGGVRIGTAEIYRLVEGLDVVVDSVVIGKRTADADVEVCLFVVLREGQSLNEDLTKTIKKTVANGATRRHVPRHIKQVSAIPYTISGKKVELAVSNMVHGEPVLNKDALANPESLDQYARII